MKSFLATLLGSTLIVGPIQIIDGDTVIANGHVYRLVGFDTAEFGDRAQCPSERALAARATARLKQLLETATPASSRCRARVDLGLRVRRLATTVGIAPR